MIGYNASAVNPQIYSPTWTGQCALWLRSDQGITTSSGTVSQWNDLSGNGLNVVGGGGGFNPAYSASGGVNNLPKLTYTASNQSLSNTTSNVLPAGTTRTVFVVGQLSSSTTGGTAICFRRGTPFLSLQNFASGGNTYVCTDGADSDSNGNIVNSTGTSTALNIYSWVYQVGQQIVFTVNGNPYTINRGTCFSDTSSITGFVIGNNSNQQAWKGDIYEVIVFSGTLTANQTAQVQAYLQARYSVQAPLSVPNCLAWWRADSNITLSGSNVSSWVDLSPYAINAANGLTTGPTISTTINGKQCCSFNGSQFLTAGRFVASGAKSVVIVAKITTLPGASTLYSVFSAGTSGGVFTELLFGNDAPYTNITFADDLTSSSITGSGFNPTLDTNSHAIVQTYNGGFNNLPASYSSSLDNVSQSIVASSSLSRTSSDLSSIGGRVASGNVLSLGSKVDIAEIIVYGSALTGAQQTTLVSYLYSRYGVL